MAQPARPLSPHIMIYRPQMTSVLSITHRLAGVALAGGALVLAYWLSSAAYGPEAFDRAQGFIGSWFGRLLLFGWTFCLFFHLCNGLRHLVWDVGSGLELSQLKVSGLLVIGAALVLTVAVWIAGYAARGAM